MVAFVDHGDAHRRTGQRVGQFKAAKPGADDNDMMAGFVHFTYLAKQSTRYNLGIFVHRNNIGKIMQLPGTRRRMS
ncbi:hypothetical protein MesoLj131a_36170 [Mesorhizobium sp. 131-2-1]|nr:hypothetical protein MesoLj131a_36170 [Mesorhizobium sp. 131-2-1]